MAFSLGRGDNRKKTFLEEDFLDENKKKKIAGNLQEKLPWRAEKQDKKLKKKEKRCFHLNFLSFFFLFQFSF